MKKLEIVRQWMAEGKILHPLEKNPNIVDLARSLMTVTGYREFIEARWLKVLKQELLDDTYRLKTSEHYVMILIDGLGSNLREYFPPDGFFETYYHRELHSVFPSTTAAALTSFVTGQWPGRHGLVGWHTHLPEHGLTATVLPFVDRMTNTPLSEKGIRMEEVVLEPTIMPELEREVCTVLPSALKDGSYSQWAHGGTKMIGYRNLSGGFQSVAANIARSTGPSLTYFYISDLDTAQHDGGTNGTKVKRIIKNLDALLLKLTKELEERGARIVVTADHGLVDVPEESQYRLDANDRMLDFLECPPSGEAVMPIFHVKPGQERRFAEHFESSFGDRIELISFSDVEALGLFGPDGIASRTKDRLGTFLGISRVPLAFLYDPPGKRSKPMVAFHGGLLPEAMRVPLFIV